MYLDNETNTLIPINPLLHHGKINHIYFNCFDDENKMRNYIFVTISLQDILFERKLLPGERPQILGDDSDELLNTQIIFIDSQCRV